MGALSQPRVLTHPPSMGRAASTLGPFVPPVAASHASLPLSLPQQAPLGLSKLNLVTNEHPKRRKKTSRRKVQGKGGPFYLPTVLPFWRPLGNTEGGFGIPKRCSEKPRVALGMLAQPLPQGSGRTGQAGEALASAPLGTPSTGFSLCTHSQDLPYTWWPQAASGMM